MIRITSFLILGFITLSLFLNTFISSLTVDPLLSPVFLLILIGFIYEGYLEFVYLVRNPGRFKIEREQFNKIVSLMLGALSAYSLSVYSGLGAVVAAGLVGVIGGSMIEKYSVPIYCGAFVGMISPEVFHDLYHVFLAALIAGIVYVMGENVFSGFGGKLGATAFAGWMILSWVSRINLISKPVITWEYGFEIILFSILAAVITYALSVRLGYNVVLSSSIVGLMGGLILPAIHQTAGNTLAAVIICASFAGMTSYKKIKTEFSIAAGGIFVGIIFMYSTLHFGGAGGKLGTIAFGSMVSLKGIFTLFENVKNRDSTPR